MGRGCLVFVGASLLAMGVGLEGLCGQVHGVCVPELQPLHKDRYLILIAICYMLVPPP